MEWRAASGVSDIIAAILPSSGQKRTVRALAAFETHSNQKSLSARYSATLVRKASATMIMTEERTAACRSEEHTSELQSHVNLVCRLLLEKKKQERLTLSADLYNIAR